MNMNQSTIFDKLFFSDFVSPVCIANSTLRVAPGDDVYVAGWGKTESGILI